RARMADHPRSRTAKHRTDETPGTAPRRVRLHGPARWQALDRVRPVGTAARGWAVVGSASGGAHASRGGDRKNVVCHGSARGVHLAEVQHGEPAHTRGSHPEFGRSPSRVRTGVDSRVKYPIAKARGLWE